MANEKKAPTDGARAMEQTTIRVQADINKKIKIKSNEIGSSYNSFVNVLLDLGLRVYESDVIFRSQEG